MDADKPSKKSDSITIQELRFIVEVEKHIAICFIHLDRLRRIGVPTSRTLGFLSTMEEGDLVNALHRLIRWLAESKRRRLVDNPDNGRYHYIYKTSEGPSYAVPPQWSFSYKGNRTIGGRLQFNDIEPALNELRTELDASGRQSSAFDLLDEILTADRVLFAER